MIVKILQLSLVSIRQLSEQNILKGLQLFLPEIQCLLRNVKRPNPD